MKIILKNNIIINKKEITKELLNVIKNTFTISNPKYEDAEKRGYYLGKINKYIFGFEEDEDNLYLFRGRMGWLMARLCQYKVKYHVDDMRRAIDQIDAKFKGSLKPFQNDAVNNILEKDFGVLEAPCGSGKTIIAISTIVHRKQPTLIIVHTKELLKQWSDRIEQFLSVPSENIGKIGNGIVDIKPITVGMAQTLNKRNLYEISKNYGFIIIDECHHSPSTTFSNTIIKFDSKYMLGLTATPYRRDGLAKLIHWTLGDVVAKITNKDLQEKEKRLIPEIKIVETNFYYNYAEDKDYSPMIKALTLDQERNNLILDNIFKHKEKYQIILSDRVAHLNFLYNNLLFDIKSEILTGKTPKKDRDKILVRIKSNEIKTLFSTMQLLGEGFDCPQFEVLHLVTPIRWHGRLQQYIGRILRNAKNKEKDCYYYFFHFFSFFSALTKCRAQKLN